MSTKFECLIDLLFTNEIPHFLAHGWDAASITDRILGVQKDVYYDVESFSEYISAKLQLA